MYSQIDSNKRKTILLIAIFFAIIIGLAYFLDAYYGGATYFVPYAIIFSSVSALVSYYHGDKLALWSSGAKAIAKEDNPYVYRLVENLCITAGIPTPKIHIIDSPAINAFATGRDPRHASMAITRGAIEQLANEELEGVIGHELSHITNYDIRVMTIVVVLAGTVALIGDLFWRARWFGLGSRRRSDDREGSNQLGAILMIAGLVFLILSPIIAELIKLAVSRRREYLADASGALLTRYPEGLARALEKIEASKIPLTTASAATAHLFIANPFSGKALAGLFSTHPPIEDRIKKLREM